ncbi:glycosyltransferase family 2 protein [Candidatus Ruminimicrobium bovinum]|uniref:glycosyltransferase family 2 protein n=1 Tax=Candidatus Ruminimicrobium bovinum TaxID=3242779 RepID=UPI0039B8CE8A
MKQNPLLSICIPTYNRSKYLIETINSIIKSDGFNEQDIEIVISDNCSTDDTSEIIKELTDKYKNIHYFKRKQPTDFADRNFIEALSLGTGEFLKLNNDIVGFNNGTLKIILDKIKENLETKTPIFFQTLIHNQISKNISKLFRLNESLKEFYFNDINDFINTISTATTWIANFGCWRQHFEEIKNKDRFLYNQFMQVDWTLSILLTHKKAKVYIKNFYNPFKIKKEGKVDAFNVHGQKFLQIYQYYLNKGLISKKSYENEKRKVLIKVLIPMLALNLTSKKHFFQINGLFDFLKDYKTKLYMYFSILIELPLCIIFLLLKKFINIS